MPTVLYLDATPWAAPAGTHTVPVSGLLSQAFWYLFSSAPLRGASAWDAHALMS